MICSDNIPSDLLKKFAWVSSVEPDTKAKPVRQCQTYKHNTNTKTDKTVTMLHQHNI